MSGAERRSKWKWQLLLVPIIPVVIVFWMICSGIRESWQAEQNLHATLFTIRLAEEFVHTNGRWPGSWSELEEIAVPAGPPKPRSGELSVVRIGGQHGYAWPRESKRLQQCVEIDFTPDLEVVMQQNPMEFEAIKPIGPYYEYRDYGFVESLQATLREATIPPTDQAEDLPIQPR